MAGCGYVCPQCEGAGVMENGTPCNWCNQSNTTTKQMCGVTLFKFLVTH